MEWLWIAFGALVILLHVFYGGALIDNRKDLELLKANLHSLTTLVNDQQRTWQKELSSMKSSLEGHTVAFEELVHEMKRSLDPKVIAEIFMSMPITPPLEPAPVAKPNATLHKLAREKDRKVRQAARKPDPLDDDDTVRESADAWMKV